MSFFSGQQRFFGMLALGFFVVTGTYNAIVINSESSLANTNIKFVKRLDELYGVTVPGRDAASLRWKKIEASQSIETEIKPTAIPSKISIADRVNELDVVQEVSTKQVAPTAAVKDDLNLNLMEVHNPKKWQNAAPGQFSGTLSTSNGTIEALSVNLPDGEKVSVSFSEMSGNVFEYDYNGEFYSAMMYQVDQNSYMVTFSNGPLEGTRLKFNKEAEVDQSQPDMPSSENVIATTENPGEQPQAQEAQPEVTEPAEPQQAMNQEPAPMTEEQQYMQEQIQDQDAAFQAQAQEAGAQG